MLALLGSCSTESQGVCESLCKALKDEPDSDVRCATVDAIGEFLRRSGTHLKDSRVLLSRASLVEFFQSCWKQG